MWTSAKMATDSTDGDLDLLLDCESVHSDDDEGAVNAEKTQDSKNLVTFMHSYAAGPDSKSDTDTGSDEEPDTKPDVVPGSRPKPVPKVSRSKPVPTNIVRNLSNQELKAKPRIRPRKRESSYTLFGRTQRETVIKQYHIPKSDFKGINKKIAELWNELPRSEKEKWKRQARRITEKLQRNEKAIDQVVFDLTSDKRLKCGHPRPSKSCYICLRFLKSQESILTRVFARQQTVTPVVTEKQNKKKRKRKTQSGDTVVKRQRVEENPSKGAHSSSSSNIDGEYSTAEVPQRQSAKEDRENGGPCDVSDGNVSMNSTANLPAEAVTGEKTQVMDAVQPISHLPDNPIPSVITTDISSNSQVQQLLSKYVAFKDPANESKIFLVAKNKLSNNYQTQEENKTVASVKAGSDQTSNNVKPQDKENAVDVKYTGDANMAGPSSQSKLNIVMKDVSKNSEVQQILSKYIETKDRSTDSGNESKVLLVVRNKNSSNKIQEEEAFENEKSSSDTNVEGNQSKLNIVMKDVSKNSEVQQLLSKYIEPNGDPKVPTHESKILLVARNQTSNITDNQMEKAVVRTKALNDSDTAENQSKLNIVMKDVSKNSEVQQLLSKYIEPKDGSKDAVNESKIMLVARNQVANYVKNETNETVGSDGDSDYLDDQNSIDHRENKTVLGEAESTNGVKGLNSKEILNEKKMKKFDDLWECGSKARKVDDFENELKKSFDLQNFEKIGTLLEKKLTKPQKIPLISNNKIVIENRWKCEVKLGETTDFEDSLKGVVYFGKSKSETKDIEDGNGSLHRSKKPRLSDSLKRKPGKNKKVVAANPSRSVQEHMETGPTDSSDCVVQTVIRKKYKRYEKRCEKCKACLREEDCRKCDYCLDRKAYGGSGTLKQKCRLKQCEKMGLVFKNTPKAPKELAPSSVRPVTRSFDVKECKSDKPGMTIFKVTELQSDKQAVTVTYEIGKKSAYSKTKHLNVTKRVHDKSKGKMHVNRVPNYDLENPRRSTRLTDKCGNIWKKLRERNEDRKKRSDLLRKKLKDQHQILRGKAKKNESNKSKVGKPKANEQSTEDRKTNLNKGEENETQNSNESIANRLRGKDRLSESMSDESVDLKNLKNNTQEKRSKVNTPDKQPTGKMKQMPEKAVKVPTPDKQSLEKHDGKLDPTDKVQSEKKRKMEHQKALVRQHAFFGSLKFKKGSCGYCLACRREANCGKCNNCKDMRQFGGRGIKKQKCKMRMCIKEKRKIKTSSKAAENMEKASDDENITRPESSKDETGDAKQSKTPRAGKIKSSTITDKISGETKINTEALKLRSKEQNKKSETGVKKSVISQKYDPVRAKAKVISKKAKEHGQKLLKQNSKMDKSGSSQQNQGTNQLRRSLREAKITNFKDLFRDAYKNTEESEKVVAKKNEMVGQKDKALTNIDSMAIKTKIIPDPPIIYPNIKFKDPKSEVKGLKTQLSKKKLAQQKIQKKLTQLNEKPQTQCEEKGPLRRKRRKCGSCGPCERADDCGLCRYCLDKVQFGGPGTLKKKCLLKQCENLYNQDITVQNEPPGLSPQKINNTLDRVSEAGSTDEQGVKIKVEIDDEINPGVSGTQSCLPLSLNMAGLYTPAGIEEKSIFIPQVSFVDKENNKTIVSQSGAYLPPNRPILFSSQSQSSKLVPISPSKMLSGQSLGASSSPTKLGSQNFGASSNMTVINTDNSGAGSIVWSSILNNSAGGVNKSPGGVNKSPGGVNNCPGGVNKSPGNVNKAPSSVHNSPINTYYNTAAITNLIKQNPNGKFAVVTHKCNCMVLMNVTTGYAIPTGALKQCHKVQDCDLVKSQKKLGADKVVPMKLVDKLVQCASTSLGGVKITTYRPEENDTKVVTKRRSGNLGVKSGYNLFFAATIEDVSKENPNLRFGEMNKIVGSKWRALSGDERKKWNTKARNESFRDAQGWILPNSNPSPKPEVVKKRRPVYGYLLFSREMRKVLSKEEPELDFCQLGKKIGEKWKNLSTDEQTKWNERADQQNEASDISLKKTAAKKQKKPAEKQHSAKETLGQKKTASQRLSGTSQDGDMPMDFKIEMIDDSYESNNVSLGNIVSIGNVSESSILSVSNNVPISNNASGWNSDLRVNSTTNSSSDLAGTCAIGSNKTNSNQTTDGTFLPVSEIKTEPMDQGESPQKVCDNATLSNLPNNRGSSSNSELQSAENGRSNGTHVFENDWLRQNNIVIKQEPEDECSVQGSQVSSKVIESPNKDGKGQCESDKNIVLEKVMADDHRQIDDGAGISNELQANSISDINENSEKVSDDKRQNSDSVGISTELQENSISDSVEIKTEPVDPD